MYRAILLSDNQNSLISFKAKDLDKLIHTINHSGIAGKFKIQKYNAMNHTFQTLHIQPVAGIMEEEE